MNRRIKNSPAVSLPLRRLPAAPGRVFRWMAALGVPILVGFVSAASLRGEPVLVKLQPWGAALGRPFTLTLVGKGLEEQPRVLSSLPASFTPLVVSPREASPGRQDRELAFLVELQPGAEPGLYPIRVATAQGLSNVLLFSLGTFPEVEEKESRTGTKNDRPEESQALEAPVTVNGTLMGPDRDVYRFQARRGQRLVLEVEARRLGSALDPVLRVLDAGREQIAINDDAPALGADCRLDLTFADDGEYYAVVHDARFSRQEKNHYRLKIGDFAYADGVYPLGWKRGERTQVELIGGNASASASFEVDLTRAGEKTERVWIQPPGPQGGLPLPFLVGDWPEVLEPAGSLPVLPPSTVVNGRISRPGEIDRYRLEVTPEEHWMVELTASGSGLSSLFGVLTAYDEQGQVLASAGDDIPDPDNFSLLSAGRTSEDPYLSLTVPPGVKALEITVQDLVGRGGPLFGYRLLARKDPPDFTLSLATPYVNLPEGGLAVVEVNVDRRGYTGPIQLTIPGAGKEISVFGGYVRGELEEAALPASGRGILGLKAEPGGGARILELEVWGEARLEDGSVLRRRALGPGLVTQIQGGTGIPDVTFRDPQRPFVAPWLGMQLPAMVVPPSPVRLNIHGVRELRLIQGMSYPLHWEMESDDPAVSRPLRVSADAPGSALVNLVPEDRAKGYGPQGVMLLRTLFSAPAQRFDLVLSADIEVGGRRQTVYSPMMSVEVLEGYTISLAEPVLNLAPGDRGRITGRLQREAGFDAPVKIEVRDLPGAVSCGFAEVTPEEPEFQLECQAAGNAPSGEFEILLVSSSEFKGTPYSISPVEARLRVHSRQAAEQVPLER